MELSRLSVLYVDDELDLLQIGKIFLGKLENIQVVTSSGAVEALDILASGSFDAIVSDYQMPGMDGIQFLYEVRKRFGDIPFILFTGRGREEVVIQAINGGADFYLQKGGEPKSQFAELGHKIRQAVRRKEAERELMESEKRFSDIIDFLPDPTFAINVSGRVIAWNHAVEELTGIPAADILDKGKEDYTSAFYKTQRPILIDLIDEPDEIIQEYYTHIRREGTSVTAETSLVHSDGTPLIVLTKVSRLYNQAGEVTGAIESIRDISNQKEAEREIRTSEERYRSVVNDQTDLIARFTPDGIITFTNEAYNQYFAMHLGLHEICGKNIRDIMHIANYDIVEKFLASLTPNTPTRNMERVVTGRDGNQHWQLWTVRAIFDDNGTCIDYQVVGRDITERKEAEEKLQEAYEEIAADEEELRENYQELLHNQQALEESKERFRTLFDLAPFACTLLDHNGTYLLANHYIERVTGYPLSEIIGKRSDEIGVISHDEQVRLEELLRTRGSLEDEVVTIVTRDGELRTVLTSATYITSHGETQVLSTMIDITERERIEEELINSNRQITGIADTIPGVVYQFYARDSGERGLYYASRRTTEIFGIPDDPETFFPAFTSCVAEEDRSLFLASIDKAVREESRWEFEGRYIRPSGDLMYFKGISAPVRVGEELVFSGVLLDITSQKKAEEALSESEIRYRSLFEQGGDAIMLLKDDRCIDCNHAALSMFGYSRADMLGLTPFELSPRQQPGGASSWEAGRERTAHASAGDPQVFEWVHLTSAGEEFFAEISLNRVILHGDTHLIAIIRNITERKRSEEALAKVQAFNALLLDTSPSFIVAISSDGRTLMMNQLLLDTLEYTADEVTGRDYLTTFVPESDREELAEVFSRIIQDLSITRNQNRIISKSGKVSLVEWRGRPVRSTSDNIDFFVGIGNIIS